MKTSLVILDLWLAKVVVKAFDLNMETSLVILDLWLAMVVMKTYVLNMKASLAGYPGPEAGQGGYEDL